MRKLITDKDDHGIKYSLSNDPSLTNEGIPLFKIQRAHNLRIRDLLIFG
jgi:hypothetical protein